MRPTENLARLTEHIGSAIPLRISLSCCLLDPGIVMAMYGCCASGLLAIPAVNLLTGVYRFPDELGLLPVRPFFNPSRPVLSHKAYIVSNPQRMKHNTKYDLSMRWIEWQCAASINVCSSAAHPHLLWSSQPSMFRRCAWHPHPTDVHYQMTAADGSGCVGAR